MSVPDSPGGLGEPDLHEVRRHLDAAVRATAEVEDRAQRAQDASAGILRRVEDLEAAITTAQELVLETGRAVARSIEESAAPLLEALRERARELGAHGVPVNPGGEPDADGPGTGLAPGDLEDAVVRLAAREMVLQGVPREEAAGRLRDEHGIDDPQEVVDEAYGTDGSPR